VDSLRFENGVPDYATRVNRSCLKSFEKAARLPEDHPRFETWRDAVPPKRDNKRRSWKQLGDKLSLMLPASTRSDGNRLPIRFHVRPPWENIVDYEIYASVPGIAGRDDELEKKKEAAILRLNDLDADMIDNLH
jgi:hypothetical protein